MKHTNSKKAFTLIELLVVVLIIGILAAIALPQYNKAVKKSQAVQALIMVRAMRDSAIRYKLENGVLPSSINDLDITVPGTYVQVGGNPANSHIQLSKGFICTITPVSGYCYSTPGNLSFEYGNNPNLKITCTSVTLIEQQTCQAFGGRNGRSNGGTGTIFDIE